MQIIVPPPQPPVRDYRIGNAALPVPIPGLAIPHYQNDSINAFLFAALSPDGSHSTASLYLDGSSVPVIGNASVRTSVCENDGLGSLAFLRLSLHRKPGTTDEITAGTVFVRSNPSYAITAVNTSTEVLTCPAHGFVDGQVVQFGGTPPGGLSTSTDYIVRDATFNTFKVAATLGGSAVNLTDAGTNPTVKPKNGVLIARLQHAAAAANEDPGADWFYLPCCAGFKPWADGSANALSIEFESATNTALELQIEACGEI